MEFEKKFYTISEATKLTGLSKKELRSGCHSGRFPFIRSGRNFKVDLAEIDAILNKEKQHRED